MKFIFLFISFIYYVIHPTLALPNSNLLPITDANTNNNQMQVYIVHVHKPNLTKSLTFTNLVSWYTSFLPNSTLDSGEPRMIYAYAHAVSGFAARLTSREVEAMKSLDGFVYAHRQLKEKTMTTYTPAFLGLNRKNGLWPESSMGEGRVIALIDSGLEFSHPSFSDTGMTPPPNSWKGKCGWFCNNKIIGAVGYKKGRSVPPTDNIGHGTHCAGIAAGNFVDDASVLGQASGTASGIAPRAHLAIYKVMNKRKDGSYGGDSSDVLKGIDDAIRDGVDVLSMSHGSGCVPMYMSSVIKGSFAAVSKGIVAVAVVGNSGPVPSKLDNDAPWVLTVGASSIDRRIFAVVRLGNGVELYGQSANQPNISSNRQIPLIFPGVDKSEAKLVCRKGSLDDVNAEGKIVVCSCGGDVENVDKGKVVRAAKGAGMIIINDQLQMNTTYANPHVVPAANIGYDDAKRLLDYYFSANKTPTAAFSFEGTRMGYRPAPTLASFSSRGPSPHNGNIIKPDVIAPGVNILSAWPFQVGPNAMTSNKIFTFCSGTSMTVPNVAGIVALLKNSHPDWSPAVIKSALMTTASAVDLDGNPILDDYGGEASIFGMGSGLVNPLAANEPGLVYDIQVSEYIGYLCGSGFTDNEVTAMVSESIRCDRFDTIPAEQLNYPSILVNLQPGLNKTIRRTVRNVGVADSVYGVEFDEPEGVSMDVEPLELEFDEFGEELSYEITFGLKSGFIGSVGKHSEGQLVWNSGKYSVRSPIIVTFN